MASLFGSMILGTADEDGPFPDRVNLIPYNRLNSQDHSLDFW
jgi:hypothetical protein